MLAYAVRLVCGSGPVNGLQRVAFAGDCRLKFLALIALLCRFSNAADEATLRGALDAHRWFELRDSALSGQVPTIYRFFVAVAFNDVCRAEKELSAAVRSGAYRDKLAGMYYAMNRLYFRLGRYHNGVVELRRCWSQPDITPPDAEAEADADALDRLPDQQVQSRRPATVTFRNWSERSRVVAPLLVNGQAVQFALDTDAGMSVVSEAEAKRLGLRMIAGPARSEGFTGKWTTNVHFAVADCFRLGNTQLRNVAFTVYPDDLDIWSDYPVEQWGTVGLPVLLAVETIQWDRNRELRIGFPPAHADLRNANLSFDGLDPLALIEIAGHKMAVDLDTGTTLSTMWPLFVKNFPELLKDAYESTTGLLGATGSADVPSAILPELRMTVGGFPIVYHKAPVLLSTTIEASNWHYGQLGIDQLAQASDVTIDFKALKIQLR